MAILRLFRSRTGLLQTGALPFRADRGSGLEIALVTSRDTGRWVIPKGWPKRGKALHEAAADEAREEAGLIGEISVQALGSYFYDKRLHFLSVAACRVEVFPLRVTDSLATWRESARRSVEWFAPDQAAAAVEEPELAELIASFQA